jgi:NSS family neurotransmitter:Na+ symporter
VSSQRGEFGSRFGFIMAAAGSAVGLGNIWGFPTQAASNGGAAFVVVYLLLAFLLAYPVLMAELTLGRHAHGNMITALAKVSRNGTQRGLGNAGRYCGNFYRKPHTQFLCHRLWVDDWFRTGVPT